MILYLVEDGIIVSWI